MDVSNRAYFSASNLRSEAGYSLLGYDDSRLPYIFSFEHRQ